VSSFEGTRATRLLELWFQQSLWDEHLSIRFGQLAADSEFLIDKGASVFLETSWPALLAQDLPSGGPTYPLTTTGVRVATKLNERVGLMLAVFNGDPASPHCTGDPQVYDTLDIGFDYSGVSDRVRTVDLVSGVPVARNSRRSWRFATRCKLSPVGRCNRTSNMDFQYIVHPGGKVPNETRTSIVGNATVFGIRTTVNF
jgi:carbohydrate-selective porin OprB